MTRRLGSIRRRGFTALASVSLAAALAGGGALIGCGTSNNGPDAGDGGMPDGLVEGGMDQTVTPMDAAPDTFMPTALPAPTFTPPAGTIASGSTVAIACPGVPVGVTASIYYSTDGTNPSSEPLVHSQVYSGPIQITMMNETIRAVCGAPLYKDSMVSVATYTLAAQVPCSLSPVGFSPGATTLNNDSLVTLNEAPAACDGGVSSAAATICFTVSAGTAGTVPTCDANAKCTGTSLTYSAGAGLGAPGSVTLNGGITDAATGKATVQAIACQVGHTTTAPVVQTYTLQASTPTMQGPAPGMLAWNASGWVPTMVSATNAATLRFTTTGTPPDCTTGTLLVNAAATPVNPGPLPTPTNATYSGIACKPGYAPSGTATFAYTIQLPAPAFVDSTSTLGALVTEGTGTYDRAFSISVDPTPDTYTGPGVPAGMAAGLYACVTTNGTAPACGGGDGTCAAGTPARVVGGTSGPAAPGAGLGTATAIGATGTVVKAVACSAKFVGSASATAAYTLQLDPPSLNPPACTKAGVVTSCTVAGTGAPTKSFQLPAGGWTGGTVEESFGTPPPSAAAGAGPAYGAVCAIKGAGVTPACMGAGCAAGSTAIQPASGAQAFTATGAGGVPLANGGITPVGNDTWNFIGCPPVTGAGSTFAASNVTSISFAPAGQPLAPTITPGTGNNTNPITPVLTTTDLVATTLCYTLGTTAAPPVAPACASATTCVAGSGTAIAAGHPFGSAGIASLTLSSGGSGYTSAPTVTVAPSNGPNGGNQAQFTATLGFPIASIAITSGGSGCAAVPVVTLAAPGTPGGVTAVFTANVSGESNAITSFTAVNNGFGYTAAPMVTITGCTVAPVVTAVLAAGGSVVALPQVSAGTGYGAVPAVTISGGGGSGASAVANPDDSALLTVGAPITQTSLVINAVACVAGPLQSSTSSATYTFTLQTPDITDTSKPAPVTTGNLNGATAGAVTVGDTLVVSTKSTFGGEQLCVSTDGSAVDCTCTATAARGFQATPYTVPGAAVVNGATIKAIACNGTNQVASGVQTATLALSLQPPVFTPPGGTYEAAQTVTLAAQGGGNTICYGVNGTATCNGAGGCATGTSQAVTAIPLVAQNNTVINAITCNGANASAPSSATYHLAVTPAVLTNNPSSTCPANAGTQNVQLGLDCALSKAGGATPPGNVCATVDANEGAPTPAAAGSNAQICYSTTSTVAACTPSATVTCFSAGAAGTITQTINVSATTTISTMSCLTGANINFTSSSSTLTLPFTGFKTGARVVDGVLLDWANDTASTQVATGTATLGYFAYDGANFDFAYQGGYTAATANQDVLFYVGDGQASGGTNAVIMGTAPAGATLPGGFDARYAIVVKTSTGTGTLYTYNGTSWDTGAALPAAQVAQAGSAVEVQVPYGTLGSITTPTVLGIFATSVGQATPVTADWWPTGAGNLPYVHYYMDNINSCLAPNSVIH